MALSDSIYTHQNPHTYDTHLPSSTLELTLSTNTQRQT
ncbi:hypothetical protein COLO4_09270 [Corchorus olitorius]|uniref:Uncharacterized protein n=1 Tax=Corchorus olitorius TaxID=93759 RepID=A0A1R3KCQ0_9ROSI|nr:hypothetical protein COLO4_09270 [Corchorus olitorius]